METKRPRIRTAVINGRRVEIKDKVFFNGIFRDIVKNTYKAASSGDLSEINDFIHRRQEKQRRQTERAMRVSV